jgi:hypothetical protein
MSSTVQKIALLRRTRNVAGESLNERLARRQPRLHAVIIEIGLAGFDPWWAFRKSNGIDTPTPGSVETSPCQHVRTDFARKILGKLFVGGFACIGRLFPIPFDPRAGYFDDRRLGTVGRMSRCTVMRGNSHLHVKVWGWHSIEVMVAVTVKQQKRTLHLHFRPQTASEC